MATLLIILNGQSKFHSTSFYVVAYTQLHAHQLIEPLTAVVSFGMLHHCPPVVVMCLLTTQMLLHQLSHSNGSVREAKVKPPFILATVLGNGSP